RSDHHVAGHDFAHLHPTSPLSAKKTRRNHFRRRLPLATSREQNGSSRTRMRETDMDALVLVGFRRLLLVLALGGARRHRRMLLRSLLARRVGRRGRLAGLLRLHPDRLLAVEAAAPPLQHRIKCRRMERVLVLDNEDLATIIDAPGEPAVATIVHCAYGLVLPEDCPSRPIRHHAKS